MLQRCRFASTLTRFATAVVLFLPTLGMAQTQPSANTGAVAPAPLVRLFSDGADDRSARITADAAGNFYIAADLSGVRFNNSFGVLKYSPQGKLLGAFHFNPTTLSNGFANDVAVDANGNIYAGGFTFPFGGLLISFDSSGNTRWTQFMGDTVVKLALDASDNVYAGTTSGAMMVISKFTSDGALLWSTTHEGTRPVTCASGVTPGCITDLKLDANGDVIAFGLTRNSNPEADATVVKLDPQGNILWFHNFSQQADFNKITAAGAIGPDNGIYSTGQAVNPFSGERFNYTVKYDTNGNLIFALAGEGVGGNSVVVDPTGNALVTGATLVQGEEVCSATKLAPSGSTVWNTQIPCSTGILSDSQGDGYIYGSTAGGNYLIGKLNSSGTLLWTFQGSTGFSIPEIASAVIDPLGNLLITGYGLPVNAGNDEIVTIKIPKNFNPN